ncbi:MAG: PIN domain-containing protein [Bryobacteraceae bacterium]
MVILLDSNVLLRSVQPHHPHCSWAETFVATLRLRNDTLCVAPQNLIEFWAVATRPADDNGLGMSPSAAAGELARLLRLFRLLPSTPEVFERWRELASSFGVSGKQAHDAHLVALMLAYAVGNILTFNGSDFRRYAGITALDPRQF